MCNIQISLCRKVTNFHLSALRAGGGFVVTAQADGREDGCQTCGTHISDIAGLIYTIIIYRSMELSRPAVMRHHGHLTLTLDFQGQILNMLYLRNERAD